MSQTSGQSTNSKTIACNTFIIDQKESIKYTEENNISAFKNEYEKIRCYKKNVPNDELIETVRNKVTLNIKKDRGPEKNTPYPVYTNVMIGKKKYV